MGNLAIFFLCLKTQFSFPLFLVILLLAEDQYFLPISQCILSQRVYANGSSVSAQPRVCIPSTCDMHDGPRPLCSNLKIRRREYDWPRRACVSLQSNHLQWEIESWITNVATGTHPSVDSSSGKNNWMGTRCCLSFVFNLHNV